MTNLEIIENERLLNNIDEELELDTFQGWKNRGYQIIKGQKALFKTKIWKPRKIDVKEVKDENEESNEENNEDKKSNSKFIMVNSAFFSEKQVQKLA